MDILSPEGEVILIFGIVGLRVIVRGARLVSEGEEADSDLVRRGFTFVICDWGATEGLTKPSSICRGTQKVSKGD